ncbi:MAG TPA: tol-pal system protein YbgF [Aliiroseovarius sp.]|nr:tol-pal system protein YbgF [Aliiroseovarius sp.]
MRGRRVIAGVILALSTMGGGVLAQDRGQTLADIRQELSVLYVEIQNLKRELSTTGAPAGSGGFGSTLDRLDAIEATLTALIARTEELEHRIDRIVKDGTNRIGDLEFRLVELEGGDVSQLGQTTTLGGGTLPATATGPVQAGSLAGNDAFDAGGQMAVGEEDDFNAAAEAFDAGNFADAAARFDAFAEAYPGSPLSDEASFMRAQAYKALGQTTKAARGFLDLFSGNPNGNRAPEALFELGVALGDLGQTSEACVTLAEVSARFPNSPKASDALTARQALGCN